MTNIKISGELPYDVTLHLQLGNQEKEINNDVKEVTFTTDLSGKHWLEIEEAPATHKEKINNLGLFLLYTLISSIIYVFQRIGDFGKWEKDIKAYIVKGRFEIDLVDTVEIELIYLPSEYHEEQASWSYPSLQVQPSLKSKIEFNENPLDFQNKLNDYIRGFATVCTVGVLFFGSVALKAILGGDTAIAIVFSLMVMGVLTLAIGVVRSQRKKCGKLYETFVSKKTVPFEHASQIGEIKDQNIS